MTTDITWTIEDQRRILGFAILHNPHDIHDVLMNTVWTEYKLYLINQAILEISDDGLDLVTLRDKLAEMGELDTIGGVDYIVGLVEEVK